MQGGFGELESSYDQVVINACPSLENDRKSDIVLISGDISMFLPKSAFKTYIGILRPEI